MTPTVLNVFEVPVPKEIDSRVLKEIFEDGSDLARRETVFTTAAEKKMVRREEVYNEEDEDAIKKKLQKLDYL